jgi:hypothetical protein
MWHLRLVVIGAAVVSCLISSSAFAQFADLLKRVPPDANAILLGDIQGLHSSPIGQQQNWAAGHRDNYLAGIQSIPPSVSNLLIAAQINTTTGHKNWKISLSKLKQEVTLAQLTGENPGSVDQVAGQAVILGPRSRTYYVPFSSTITGTLTPANRQLLARWIRFAKQNQQIGISPYLMEAATSVGQAGQMVMAVDLADVLDPAGIAVRLRNCQALAGQKVDFDGLAKLIAGLRGIKASIRAEAILMGQLRLDFSGPADMLAPVAKPLILEALDRMGMHIDDLQQWNAQVDGMAVIMGGPLSGAGARQMLSPLLTPGARLQGAAVESPGQQAGQDPRATASLRYYRSIKTLLDELQTCRVKTFRHMAALLEQYAESIDELPLLNVDLTLLKFGQWVSASLRGMASNAMGTQQRDQFLEANMTEGFYNYGGYGTGYLPGYGISSNYTALGNVEGLGVARERMNRAEEWNAINQGLSQLRIQMTEKYQVEF